MATVGAIVPSYDRAAMLCECIESLLMQTRSLDEIVVVDDGSSDGTAEIVSAWFGSRVRTISTRNRGKSAALNLGLEQLRTDFIWICDDDDIAAPHACETLAGALERAPDNVGFTYGHYRIFSRERNGITLRPPSFWADPDEKDIHINVLEDLHVFQFATMFRRSALDRAGRFREDLLRSQDLDMMIRITSVLDGIYVPETIFFQRDHAGARGPALDRVAREEAFKRWLHYDCLFYGDLALAGKELVPSFARTAPTALRARAADLQRAVVFGRRGMWSVALDALDRAASAAPQELASSAELRLAGRLIRHGLPSAALPSRRDLARFRELRRRSVWATAVCEAVAIAMVRRLRCALRDRRHADASRDASFLLAISDLRWLVSRIKRRGTARGATFDNVSPIVRAGVSPAEIATFTRLLATIAANGEARQINAVRIGSASSADGLLLRSA